MGCLPLLQDTLETRILAVDKVGYTNGDFFLWLETSIRNDNASSVWEEWIVHVGGIGDVVVSVGRWLSCHYTVAGGRRKRKRD